jgi:hypothetical protein
MLPIAIYSHPQSQERGKSISELIPATFWHFLIRVLNFPKRQGLARARAQTGVAGARTWLDEKVNLGGTMTQRYGAGLKRVACGLKSINTQHPQDFQQQRKFFSSGSGGFYEPQPRKETNGSPFR